MRASVTRSLVHPGYLSSKGQSDAPYVLRAVTGVPGALRFLHPFPTSRRRSLGSSYPAARRSVNVRLSTCIFGRCVNLSQSGRCRSVSEAELSQTVDLQKQSSESAGARAFSRSDGFARTRSEGEAARPMAPGNPFRFCIHTCCGTFVSLSVDDELGRRKREASP